MFTFSEVVWRCNIEVLHRLWFRFISNNPNVIIYMQTANGTRTSPSSPQRLSSLSGSDSFLIPAWTSSSHSKLLPLRLTATPKSFVFVPALSPDKILGFALCLPMRSSLQWKQDVQSWRRAAAAPVRCSSGWASVSLVCDIIPKVSSGCAGKNPMLLFYWSSAACFK